MDFKDLSPEDQQAILDRVKRARTETTALLKEGRYADAFDIVYYAALIDPESLDLSLRIAHQVEGIHLLRPDQIELLRQHASEKRPLAQYLYGFWLWFNRERVTQIDDVIELMEAASKWGIGDASYVLYRIYESGCTGAIDKPLSDYYYELAGKQQLNFKWFCESLRNHIYGRRGEREDPQTTITVLREIIGLPEDTDLRWQTEREKELQTEAAQKANPRLWHLLYECYDALGQAWAGEIYAKMGIDQGDYHCWLDLIRCRCTDYKDTDANILPNKQDEYLRLLREGAEEGSSEMMYRLGTKLCDEWEDEATSAEHRAELEPEIQHWLERASDLGSGEASSRIAYGYSNGFYGYNRDEIKIWHYYHRGAIQDNSFCYYALYVLCLIAQNEDVPEEEREFHLPADAEPMTADQWEMLGRVTYQGAEETWPDDEAEEE